MIVISIDPGSAGSGNALARSEEGIINSVWFERFPLGGRGLDAWCTCDLVIVEKPQQDSRSRAVPPRILINLAWDGGTLAAAYAAVNACVLAELSPSEWKGSEPKPVQHSRLWRILTPAERELFGGDRAGAIIRQALEKGALDRWRKHGVEYYPRAFTTHNLLDAAALNATYTGRLRKA